MEASENIQRRVDHDAHQGVLRPVGDDRVARSLMGRAQAVGMVRLELMVNTVLPRLTSLEDHPCET